MTSEDLWRATLHDFNNLLAGVQGVLDLSDPALPLDARNRLRMRTSIEDGKTLIAMARALALGRLPDTGLTSWPEWKVGLDERLGPMISLFHCPIEVLDMGAGGQSWPAPLWQDWVAAFTRQILPWAAPGPLRLEARATADGWMVTWVGDAPLPTALRPEPPAEAPRNLHSLWLRTIGSQLEIALEEVPGGIVARMGRPCAS
jgi:hypothetical protein